MKDQIDVLKELQQRVLIKGGVCAFAGMRDFVRNETKIAELEAQLDLQCATIYRRLAKKGPVFVASVSGGVCAGCGMSVPSAVQQAARLGETLVLCPHCSRILYDDRKEKGLVPTDLIQTASVRRRSVCLKRRFGYLA